MLLAETELCGQGEKKPTIRQVPHTSPRHFHFPVQMKVCEEKSQANAANSNSVTQELPFLPRSLALNFLQKQKVQIEHEIQLVIPLNMQEFT